jgi:N-acetylglucosamine-6-phosphate deacetylase
MRIRAHHFATGQLVDVDCVRGIIETVEPSGHARPDRQANWIAPALFDLQINGAGGRSFNSGHLTRADIRHVVRACREHGIAALCPTLVTGSHEDVVHGLTIIREACAAESELERALPAVHLEGPYIAAEDGPRGAHPRRHVRPPDWDEFCRFQEAAGGRIRLMTLAPESAGALPYIEKLTHSGVVAAIGHTAASPTVIRDAIGAGARLSTHLGNGSHPALPRHENYFLEQRAADALWASIICDGHHLPPSLVRCIVRVKSPKRLILTCDASPLAGLPPGRYREWDQDFEVLSGGKIIVSGTPFLAGSGAFTDLCLGNVMRFAEVSLPEAIAMASSQPRELLGLPSRRLEPGQPAELMLFDWQAGGDVQVRATILPDDV